MADEKAGVDKFGRKLDPTIETRLDAFQPWFEKHGTANGVDPDLLRALARQESAGLPGAVSATGVKGLMQMTTDTAKRFGISNREDPEQSIIGASKYLKTLLDRYQGDLVKTVMAYNSGEGHVSARVANLGSVRAEGKQYVKSILGVDVSAGYDPQKWMGGVPGAEAPKGASEAVVQTVDAPRVMVSGNSAKPSTVERLFGITEPTMGPLPHPGEPSGPVVQSNAPAGPDDLMPWATQGGKPHTADSSGMTSLERATAKVVGGSMPSRVLVEADTEQLKAGQPGTFDVAGAWWRRETVVGALVGYGVDKHEQMDGVKNFNPYEFLQANEVEFADLERYVRAGAFDKSFNEKQFRSQAARVRAEIADMELIDKGGVAGTVLGVALSIADLTTLVPGAQMARGMSAAKAAGIGLREGVTIGLAQEGALQMLETQRTSAESAINVLVMGAGGAAIRALARPGKILNPSHPHNPLTNLEARAEGEHIGVLRAGDSTTAPSEAVGTADSIGAARVAEATDTEVARAEKGAAGALTKLLAPATTLISKGTGPVSRAMLYTSSVAREILQGVYDLGGSLTKGMAKGVSAPASAEDLMLDYMGGLKSEIYDYKDMMLNLHKDLGKDLPDLMRSLGRDIEGATGGAVRANPVSDQLIQEIVRRKLVGEDRAFGGKLTQEDLAWARAEIEGRGLDFEKAWPIIDRHTFKYAEGIHAANIKLEQRMVELGLLQPEKALGKNYGLPQLWKADWIVENREQARRFFMDVFASRPDEDWLREAYGMKVEDFEKLPVADPHRAEILGEWSGDEYNRQLVMAEAGLKEAERNAGTAIDVMRVNAQQAGVATTEARKMSVAAAVAHAKAAQGKASMLRLGAYAERVEWATERAARLKAEMDFRAARANDVKAGILADTDATQANAFGTDLVDAYVYAERERVAAAAALDDLSPALQAEMRRGLFTQEDLDAVRNEAKVAKEKWREADYGANLESRTQTLDRFSKNAQALDVAASEAKRAAEHARAWRDSYSAARAGSRKLVRETSKELAQARKLYRSVSGSTTVSDYVDDLIFRMTERLDNPTSLGKETVVQGTGRLKERVIKLTPEQRKFAETQGAMNTNLFDLRDHLYRELSPRMALQERFGSLDPAPHLKKIREAYGERIDEAQQRLTKIDPNSREAKDLKKLIPLLNQEAEAATKDVVAGYRRLLNQPLSGEDTTSAVAWGLGKMRQLSFLRYGAGFVLNALPDLSTVLLHGGLKSLSPTMGMRAIKLMRDARIDPKSRELARLVQSMELVFHHSRSARLESLDDLSGKMGIGTKGTMTNKVTGGVDRAFEFASEKLAHYSGMQAWNGYWKTVVGLVQLGELNQRVAQYAGLSAVKKAELAALGIGEHEAERLSYYFKKHGADFDGIFDPNANRWHSEKDGMEMHRVLRVAIRRVSDRAIMTPGAGDTPLLMSSQLGRTVLQLATFGFKTVNTFLRPAVQKTALYGDGKALTSLATAMTLGGVVTALRGYMNEKDVENYTAKQWAWESLDRSGFFAYMSPYIDASAKLFGPSINSAVGEHVFEPTTRYSRNKWWESLAGPWMGTLSTSAGAVGSLASGDMERLKQQAFYLTPFNQWYRLGTAAAHAASE